MNSTLRLTNSPAALQFLRDQLQKGSEMRWEISINSQFLAGFLYTWIEDEQRSQPFGFCTTLSPQRQNPQNNWWWFQYTGHIAKIWTKHRICMYSIPVFQLGNYVFDQDPSQWKFKIAITKVTLFTGFINAIWEQQQKRYSSTLWKITILLCWDDTSIIYENTAMLVTWAPNNRKLIQKIKMHPLNNEVWTIFHSVMEILWLLIVRFGYGLIVKPYM